MKRALLAVILSSLAVAGMTAAPALAQDWQRPHEQSRPDPRQDHRPDFRPDPRRDSHWQAGGRLPPQWREARHVIAKPQRHHLHRAAPGQRWVRVGPDALLVVARTGVILEIRANLFR